MMEYPAFNFDHNEIVERLREIVPLAEHLRTRPGGFIDPYNPDAAEAVRHLLMIQDFYKIYSLFIGSPEGLTRLQDLAAPVGLDEWDIARLFVSTQVILRAAGERERRDAAATFFNTALT